MGERRDGPRGRDAAELVGDAAMSALEEIVERLRRTAPVTVAAEAADGPPPPGTVAEADAPAEAGDVRSGSVIALTGAVVAAVVPAVLQRIDLDEVLDRVDVQRVVDRVDVEGLVARVDLDAVVAGIDLDALLARVDLDALVHRLDIAAITREALEAVDIGEIVRESTATIGTDIVDGLRLQTMRADDLLTRCVDALLRRKRPRDTALDAPRSAP